MKAYQVCTDWSDGSVVVFAESVGKAKSMALYTDVLCNENYKDLRATRLPKIERLYKGVSIVDWNENGRY